MQSTSLSTSVDAVAPVAPVKAASTRLTAIDIVRGLAMVFMLLAHATWRFPTVDFRLHFGWDTLNPLPVLTHPEAWFGLMQGTPLFFLMSGFGLALFETSRRRRSWPEWKISRYFLIRGGLLIAVDWLLLPWDFFPGVEWNPRAHFVLTSVGLCLLAFAALRRLPTMALAGLIAAVTVGTQILYSVSTIPTDSNLIRSLLLYPSPVDPWAFGFPALPWLAVILSSYTLTRVILKNKLNFGPLLLSIGAGLMVVWALVTVFNGFGRLYHDHALIMTKHPPMLDYLSFYMGITCLLLAFFTYFPNLNNFLPVRFLSLLGQTSLFFYIFHFYVLMVLGLVIKRLPLPELTLNFVLTAVALVVLFPICRVYRSVRDRYPDSVLQYL